MNNDANQQLERAIEESRSDDAMIRYEAGMALGRLGDVRAIDP